MDNGKYLFMITGAPGAGKSTLAQKIIDNSRGLIRPVKTICEADQYWYIIGKGKYAFDPKKLPLAHEWCQKKAREAMSRGENLIVSNTNIKPIHRKPYFDMALEYGYDVVYFNLKTQFQNVHSVPDFVVDRMRREYVGLTKDEELCVVYYQDMTDELQALIDSLGVRYEF